jgi:hypothetical protein
VLTLVVGYSGEASSDAYRVADLVATRLASKHLDYARTSALIAKAMQTQRICPAWGHFFGTWILAGHLGSRAGQSGPGARLSQLGSELDADAEFNFFYLPLAG